MEAFGGSTTQTSVFGASVPSSLTAPRPRNLEWSSRSFFYLHLVMEAAAPDESDVDAQRQHLERLQKMKSTKCLCSRCGAKLKYASFTALL